MSFTSDMAIAASDMISVVGEPCSVQFNNAIYTENPDGLPIFASIEENQIQIAAESMERQSFTAARIARSDVPEITTPCQGLLIVVNEANDSRGAMWQGGAFAGCTFEVTWVDPTYAQTWLFRVKNA